MPCKPKLVSSLQRAGLALVAALAAAMLVFAGCGKGASGDACSTDSDCDAALRCCPPPHANTPSPHLTTCTTPVSNACPWAPG